MAIRNTEMGGVDFVDTVILAVDINDTFNKLIEVGSGWQ